MQKGIRWLRLLKIGTDTVNHLPISIECNLNQLNNCQGSRLVFVFTGKRQAHYLKAKKQKIAIVEGKGYVGSKRHL